MNLSQAQAFDDESQRILMGILACKTAAEARECADALKAACETFQALENIARELEGHLCGSPRLLPDRRKGN